MGGLFFMEKKMAKPEWGRKRICPSCGAKFDPDLYLKSRKGKSLSTKVSPDETSKISEDISDIDEIEIDSDDEVVSDDEPLIDISKNDQDDDTEDMDIDSNVSFIEDDDLNDNSDNEDNEDTKE